MRVRSLRFHYFTLTGDEEELEWETRAIEEFYTIWEGEHLPILAQHPVPRYQVLLVGL